MHGPLHGPCLLCPRWGGLLVSGILWFSEGTRIQGGMIGCPQGRPKVLNLSEITLLHQRTQLSSWGPSGKEEDYFIEHIRKGGCLGKNVLLLWPYGQNITICLRPTASIPMLEYRIVTIMFSLVFSAMVG